VDWSCASGADCCLTCADARSGTGTLLFAAKDEEHNDAVVLGEVLRRGLR
jgi:uncharacterized protein YeaO (DUF488 family)